ncbi:MAG: bifunctional nuclease family protein [Acidimicrobiales bacterium]
MTIEMELVGVRVQLPTNTPILLLRETSGQRRVVPIYIGGPEAHAIDLALSGTPMARPMTHDLFAEVIDGLGAALERVVVTELRGGTFYAELYLRDASGGVQTISARPSDAIALAARTGSPIFAEDALIEEAGIEEDESEEDSGDEEEMVEELRKFLDEVNPEDFLPE